MEIHVRDKSAEISLLGCCILDPSKIDAVGVDDFYLSEHGMGGSLFARLAKIEASQKDLDSGKAFLRWAVANRDTLVSQYGVSVSYVLARAIDAAEIRKFDEYAERCRAASKHRDQIDSLERQIREIQQSWQQYQQVWLSK